MSEWNFYGSSRKDTFEESLEPRRLSIELDRYREELGEDFQIKDLLRVMEIKAIALVAEGINDAPEFLADQIGKMRNDKTGQTISENLSNIAYAIESMAETG